VPGAEHAFTSQTDSSLSRIQILGWGRCAGDREDGGGAEAMQTVARGNGLASTVAYVELGFGGFGGICHRR
jgi:hypothetical protein